MKNKIVALSLVILFSFVSGVYAQDDTSSVGITPDSPFYFFKTLKENIQTFFVFGAENKARQFLHLSEVRMAEYQKMLEKGTLRQAQGKKSEIAQKTLDKYEKQLNRAVQKVEELKNKGKDVKNLSEELSTTAKKHIEVLEENLQKVPEAAKKGIEKALGVARKIKSPKDETVNFLDSPPSGYAWVTTLDWDQTIIRKCLTAEEGGKPIDDNIYNMVRNLEPPQGYWWTTEQETPETPGPNINIRLCLSRLECPYGKTENTQKCIVPL